MAGATASCVFCAIATKSTSLLHSDDKVVAFQDINPSAFRHYLVVPVAHIPTVKDLQRKTDDYSLVSHMLEVGKTLLHRDAPQSQQYRYLLGCLQLCLLFSACPVCDIRLIHDADLNCNSYH
ncbi:bifunctional adenosine 5'-phosphosulfate phosphorylase/adenylylsulfatase HINT4 [Cajanus cajan]|uniref:Histidine triad nucleotide-binding protein 3 n=1 Tax=Cajanus cajan TaxID=3821 RepID=A0A151TJL6_CAJCA|nr:bifunctional adenosine 5'-phosphosulfate phosphorylase/adenylylsulfatase HINT4 [Cajanus cajan]KYP67244.1 Histidine triad nucleotide-binding protein 3 [Cajanus cajan]